jgi:mRNA-degrading endonuclease toxin of MazEF toxin-antitoxin module
LTEEVYRRGTVVLVPFPFTDLSGKKRRPAVVLLAGEAGLGDEDLILCAITSQLPQTLSEWEVLLEAQDLVEEKLPKRSMVKVGKLFTMHKGLIAARYGALKEQKLQEVLQSLRAMFAPEDPAAADAAGAATGSATIDEAVLALLRLNAFDDHGQLRAWKTFDWDTMDRLHEKGLISDPKSKAKSVVLTEAGRRAAEIAFRRRLATP